MRCQYTDFGGILYHWPNISHLNYFTLCKKIRQIIHTIIVFTAALNCQKICSCKESFEINVGIGIEKYFICTAKIRTDKEIAKIKIFMQAPI